MPKPPATTATTAAQAISQRYATVLARWPADPTRRGRNLKELLERRVQQRVDAFTRSDDGSICEYTDAEREVDARREMLWTRLAENCYAGKVVFVSYCVAVPFGDI